MRVQRSWVSASRPARNAAWAQPARRSRVRCSNPRSKAPAASLLEHHRRLRAWPARGQRGSRDHPGRRPPRRQHHLRHRHRREHGRRHPGHRDRRWLRPLGGRYGSRSSGNGCYSGNIAVRPGCRRPRSTNRKRSTSSMNSPTRSKRGPAPVESRRGLRRPRRSVLPQVSHGGQCTPLIRARAATGSSRSASPIPRGPTVTCHRRTVADPRTGRTAADGHFSLIPGARCPPGTQRPGRSMSRISEPERALTVRRR